jgi:hypothetical protein
MLLRAHTHPGVRKKSWTLFGSAPGRRRRPGGFADLDLNTPASVINYRLLRRRDDVVEPRHDNIIKTMWHAFLGRTHIIQASAGYCRSIRFTWVYIIRCDGGVCATTTTTTAGAGEIIRQKIRWFSKWVLAVLQQSVYTCIVHTHTRIYIAVIDEYKTQHARTHEIRTYGVCTPPPHKMDHLTSGGSC